MFSPTDWEKLTPDEEVFGWLKTVFSMMPGKTSTPQTPNQRGLWGNSFPLKILGMPMLKKFHLPNQHAFHFKKGASDSCGMCKTPWCRRSRRNLFPAANLVNVSSSHPSCWGVCSITRASLATSESLATSGSSRIPSLPLKNRRILVGILKHQGIPFALDKHLLTVGICWCVFGVGELSPLQRDRFQLVS